MADETTHPTTLDLVTTRDLLDELEKRYDHILFVGCQELNTNSRRCDRRAKGDALLLIGLLFTAALISSNEFESSLREPDE